MKECVNQALTAFSEKLDASKIKEIGEEIELLFNESVAKKDAAAIRKHGLAALTRAREGRIMKKFIIASNYYDLKRAEKQADKIFKAQGGGAKGAIDALVSFLFSDAKHGGMSVESGRNAILNRYSIVDHEFRKIAGKLSTAIEDGMYDDQLLKAIWEFGEGRDVTLQMAELKDVAKVFHKANAMMSIDKASINPLYRHRKNYGASLHYNSDLVGAMKLHEFVSFMKQHIDLKEMNAQIAEWGIDPKKVKAFKESNLSAEDYILAEIYEMLKSPETLIKLTPTEGAIATAKDPTQAMRAMAEGRMFRYKSAESFAAVFKQFSDGTVYDSIMQSINANARSMAMDQALGKMPLSNLLLMKEKLVNQIPDVVERQKAKDYFETNFDYLVNVAAGTVKVNRNVLADIVANVKAVGSGLLGSAPVTAFITDPVWGSVNFAALSGDNIFSTYGRVMKEVFSQMLPGERIETAKLLGELIDDVQAITLHQVTGSTIERKKVGALTKLADFGMKISGMRLQNLHAKTVMGEMFSMMVGRELSGKAGPNSNYVKWLKTYGLDDVDVEILKIALDKRGRLYQENVRNILPSTILERLQKSDKVPFAGVTSKDLVGTMDTTDLRNSQLEGAKKQVKKLSWTEDRVKNYLNHLAVRLNTASFDMARMSSPTPTGYTNFVMNGFNASGDKVGSAALQLIMQFKAFGAGVIRNYRLLSNLEHVHAPKRRLSQLVGLLTVTGGVSLMVQDVLSGKAPRDPTAFDEENPLMGNFLTQSLIKAGAIPFFADYLLTDYASEGGSLIKDLAGPSGRMVEDASTLLTEVIKFPTDPNGFDAKKLIGPGIRWSGIANLWYAKGLLNTMILDDLKAAVDPQATRRKMKGMQKNSGMLWEQEEFFESQTPISDMGF